MKASKLMAVLAILVISMYMLHFVPLAAASDDDSGDDSSDDSDDDSSDDSNDDSPDDSNDDLYDDSNEDLDDDGEEDMYDDSPDSSRLMVAPKLSSEKAAQIAQDKYGGGILQVEADDENDAFVWKIKLLGENGEMEVKVDGQTGAIVKAEGSDDSDDDSSEDSSGDSSDDSDDDSSDDFSEDSNDNQAIAPRISSEQAVQIAKNQYGGVLVEVEPDDENDAFAWKVKLLVEGKETEVKIDGETGAIVKEPSWDIQNDFSDADRDGVIDSQDSDTSKDTDRDNDGVDDSKDEKDDRGFFMKFMNFFGLMR